MSIPTPACTPAPRPDPVPRAASTAGASRPMERTGGMENAHDTLAADCTRVEARFPHRLGRHRTPPVRSTGKIVVLSEHDVTDWISNTRRGTDGRKPTEERRCAPTSVHVRRNPCSRSPDSAFNFTGIRSGFGPERQRGRVPSTRPATGCFMPSTRRPEGNLAPPTPRAGCVPQARHAGGAGSGPRHAARGAAALPVAVDRGGLPDSAEAGTPRAACTDPRRARGGLPDWTASPNGATQQRPARSVGALGGHEGRGHNQTLTPRLRPLPTLPGPHRGRASAGGHGRRRPPWTQKPRPQAVRDLAAAASAGDINQVSTAYMTMVANCVQCHREALPRRSP